MRKITRSFGLPARLAVLALAVARSLALGGFPGMGGHSSVATAAGGVTRTYYIAADEVPGTTRRAARTRSRASRSATRRTSSSQHGADRIGATYSKALYREYTDATFTTLKPRAPAVEHLGLLGPVIRAEVGDTIKFVFKNNARSRPACTRTASSTTRPPKARRTTTAPAAPTRTTTPWRPATPTPTRGRCPSAPAPGPMDGSSVMWMYHSHVDETADTNAGLDGPDDHQRRAARLEPTARRSDVDREFFTYFTVMDENTSPYLDDNIARFADGGERDPDGRRVPREQPDALDQRLRLRQPARA